MRLSEIKRPLKELVARAVATALPARLMRDKAFFRLWERRGYHVTPVHFYEAIPDTRTLRPELWGSPAECVGVDMNEKGQLELLERFSVVYGSVYESLPGGAPGVFRLENKGPALDRRHARRSPAGGRRARRCAHRRVRTLHRRPDAHLSLRVAVAKRGRYGDDRSPGAAAGHPRQGRIGDGGSARWRSR